MTRACILLPAYNEANHIGQLIDQIQHVKNNLPNLVILVVNDGSSDQTGPIAQRNGAVVLSHPRNQGVGAAFRTGIEWALKEGFDYLLHMDSDGQISPSDIPSLTNPVINGEFDLALGSRFKQGRRPLNMSPWKAWALYTAARIIGLLTGYNLSDISCGFRCMNREVMQNLKPHFNYDYIQESLIQALAMRPHLIEVTANVHYDTIQKGMAKHVMRYCWNFVLITFYAMTNFYLFKIKRVFSKGDKDS